MDTSKLLDDYTTWLRNQYTIQTIGQSDEITTPFENMIGDYMRIYVTPLSGNRIRLSDDGITLEDLLLLGININSHTRRKIISDIRKRYGIDQLDDILSITGNVQNFPDMKQRLISAMVQINDLSTTQKLNLENRFSEQVYSYFKENNFGGLPQYHVEGKSGAPYTIDYTIPEKNRRPERMIDFQQKLSKNSIMINAYKFNDILVGNSRFLSALPTYTVIYNDDVSAVSAITQKIADDAKITLLPWHDKNPILELR